MQKIYIINVDESKRTVKDEMVTLPTIHQIRQSYWIDSDNIFKSAITIKELVVASTENPGIETVRTIKDAITEVFDGKN